MATKDPWIHIKPLTGVLDHRSLPDNIELGSWRERLNFEVTDEGRLVRASGWRKLFDADATAANYNNADLHDQLLPLLQYYDSQEPPSETDITETEDWATACSGAVKVLESQTREPITMLRECISTAGDRRLMAGTQTRIYVLNETSGNWQVLADGRGGEYSGGCGARYWCDAQLLDTVVVTNNYDPPQYWVFGDAPSGCKMQAFHDIPSLETIGLTRAAVVCEWKGLVFLGDLEMDGARAEYKVIWSDYNRVDFDPGREDSVAGSFDLSYGERVLGFKGLGDYLLVYTSLGIWQVTLVTTDDILNFRQVYKNPDGDACLAYKRTLTSLGDAHIYMGRDGIYLYNLSLPKPERVEWLHKASGVIFSDINSDCCDVHLAGFKTGSDPNNKQVYFSWARSNESLPGYTLVVNMRYLVASTIDHGFTAFCNYRRDKRFSLRDWITKYCICTPTTGGDPYTGTDIGMPWIKEGMPRVTEDSGAGCTTTPTSFFTTGQMKLEDGTLMEDIDRENADANSLCGILGDRRVDDECRSCNEKQIFIAASAQDYCLKEMGGVYYRDRLTGVTAADPYYGTDVDDDPYVGTDLAGYTSNVGTYVQDGYFSDLISGPIDIKAPQYEKIVDSFELECSADGDTVARELRLRVAVSAQAVDPLGTDCGIVWQTQVRNRCYLSCQGLGETALVAAKKRAYNTMGWPLYQRGRYFYFHLRVQNADGTAPTGGASSFSRASVRIRL